MTRVASGKGVIVVAQRLQLLRARLDLVHQRGHPPRLVLTSEMLGTNWQLVMAA